MLVRCGNKLPWTTSGLLPTSSQRVCSGSLQGCSQELCPDVLHNGSAILPKGTGRVLCRSDQELVSLCQVQERREGRTLQNYTNLEVSVGHMKQAKFLERTLNHPQEYAAKLFRLAKYICEESRQKTVVLIRKTTGPLTARRVAPLNRVSVKLRHRAPPREAMTSF